MIYRSKNRGGRKKIFKGGVCREAPRSEHCGMRCGGGLQLQMAQAGELALAVSTRGDCVSVQSGGWYCMNRRSGVRVGTTEPSV